MYKYEKEIFEGKEIEVAVGEGRKLYLARKLCPILGFKYVSQDTRKFCKSYDIVVIKPTEWDDRSFVKAQVLAVTENGMNDLIQNRVNQAPVETIRSEKELIPGLTIFNKDVVPTYRTDKGIDVVIGRDLHAALKIQSKYSDWFKRMTEWGFEEGTDYHTMHFFENDKISGAENALGKEYNGASPFCNHFTGSLQVQSATDKWKYIDHVMTFDMAKHIAIIQKTPLGMEIRKKLIELDKKNQQGLLSSDDVNAVVLNRLDEISAKCDQLLQENQELKQEIMNLKNCQRTVPNLLPGGSMNVSEMAKPLGYTAAQLNQILMLLGVQKKTDRGWELTDEYKDKGYTVEGQKYKDVYGNELVHMRWTAKGVQFIWELLSQKQLPSMN